MEFNLLGKVLLGKHDQEREYWGNRYVKFMKEYGEVYINTPYFQNEIKAVKEFAEEDLNHGDKILDLGCGYLPASEWLIERGKIELWAADLDLELARDKWEKLGKPHMFFKQIDLRERLPFDNNCFDGIISAKALTFVPSSQGETGAAGLKNIFREIFRILKPGGWLVWTSTVKGVSTWKGVLKGLGFLLNPIKNYQLKCFLPLFTYKLSKAFEPVMEKADKGIYPVFGKEKYAEIVKSAGFKDLQWQDTGGFQILVNRAVKPL